MCIYTSILIRKKKQKNNNNKHLKGLYIEDVTSETDIATLIKKNLSSRNQVEPISILSFSLS